LTSGQGIAHGSAEEAGSLGATAHGVEAGHGHGAGTAAPVIKKGEDPWEIGSKWSFIDLYRRKRHL